MLCTRVHLDGEHCLHRFVSTQEPLKGFHGLTLTRIGPHRAYPEARMWTATLHLSNQLLAKGSWSEFQNGDKYFLSDLYAGRLEPLVDALMNAPDRATGQVV